MAINEKDVRVVPEGSSYKRAVGVFKDKDDVERVIRSLKDNNYDMNRVSLLARNVDDVKGSEEITETHGNEAKEGAGVGATTGTVLGGVGGFLVGVGVLAIPGIGPVLAAGAEIAALGSTLAGAGIGAAAGGIIGALVGMGIPEEKAKVYESRVKAGDYLLIVSGKDDKVNHAESIMRDRNVEEFEIFDARGTYREDLDTTYQEKRFETERVNVRSGTHDGATMETRDLDRDGDPEVVVVDKRDNPRRDNVL